MWPKQKQIAFEESHFWKLNLESSENLLKKSDLGHFRNKS